MTEKKESADTTPRERFGKCFVSGWGMSRDGKVTIVERHEVQMKSASEGNAHDDNRQAG